MKASPDSFKNPQAIHSPFNQEERDFLEGRFMHETYIVDPALQKLIRSTVEHLQEKYPERFYFLTLAGGQSNGSFVLRTLQKRRVASDVDVYIGGKDADRATLAAISSEFQEEIGPTGLHLDGVLNGARTDRYLDLAHIPEHIAHGDFDLLALPFQCAYGRVQEAQIIVLRHIVSHQDRVQIWSEICEYHRQSMLLQNAQWSEQFNNAIAQKYQTAKSEKFALPASPQELLNRTLSPNL